MNKIILNKHFAIEEEKLLVKNAIRLVIAGMLYDEKGLSIFDVPEILGDMKAEYEKAIQSEVNSEL